MADPLWLPDVLRAEGLSVREWPGWRQRRRGDFGTIWGVVAHHTGDQSGRADNPGYIANHPTLGLASQLHLNRKGEWTVVGAGIAWHAGPGSWPGIARDNANAVTIGIEAENSGTEGWTAAQRDSYVRGVAAILRRLGRSADHVIGHREWYHGRRLGTEEARRLGGKWDPGGLDMDVFRRDVQARIDGAPTPSEEDDMGWLDVQIKNFKNIPVSWKDVLWFMDRNTSQARDQLLGEDDGKGGFKGWSILGRSKVDPKRDNTVVEAVAEVKADVAEIKRLLMERES